MKQVQAMVTLVLIDGVTHQIVMPKNIVTLMAKQALAMVQEFGGMVVPCDFASILPMEANGMPFNIINSGAENES